MEDFSQRVGNAFNVGSDDVDRFKHRLMRTKTIQSTSGDPEGDDGITGSGGTSASSASSPQKLERCLTTLDLISLGVGSSCGTGMYVVAGLVAKNVAGPAVVISFIIAAFASILSGVCYGEFGVRVPKTTGSAYMYSYVAVGEFVAFLIGWNLILEYMIGSAAGASALSACFDALINHTMSSHLEENVGTVIGRTYPDFLGCAIGLVMTVVLAIGVKKSVRFNNVLNVINFLVWVFIVFAGFFFMDGANWETGFAPYGASGIFSGAATCFYAFIGFDIIATTGEEAKDPSRSIPMAIIVSLCVCLTAYITSSLVLTLLVPYYDIEGDSALIDMFVQNGLPGAKFVVALGAMCALTVSLFGSMWPMPRVIYAMSRDGLLFQFLSVIHPSTGTPLVTTIATGVLAAFMALCVGLQILVEMMSIGTLLAYTLVVISVFILRYQPSSHDDEIQMTSKLDTIDEGSDDVLTPSESESGGILGVGGTKSKLKDRENLIGSDNQKSYGSLPFVGSHVESGVAYVKRHFKVWWLRCGFPSDDVVPTNASAQTVIIFVGVLAMFELAMCLLAVFGNEFLARGAAWAIICFLIFLAGIFGSLIVILRQPQNKRQLDFMTPAVPFLPALAILINMYLMLKLPGLTWARLGVWILIGLLLYFSYSMWHSVKEKKKSDKPTELHPHPPPPGDRAFGGESTVRSVAPVTKATLGNAITQSEGYGYDQGGYTEPYDFSSASLTGPVPTKAAGNGGIHGPAADDEQDLPPWPPAPSRTNASSPWTPQHPPVDRRQLDEQQQQPPPRSAGGPPGRNPKLNRRQSSEKPPRPRQPPRRQSTEGSDKPERPPPPRRQSTESSASSSNPWTSQDRTDAWTPQYPPPGAEEEQQPPWQTGGSAAAWDPQHPAGGVSEEAPDQWSRGPTIAPTNPFWNAIQESQQQ